MLFSADVDQRIVFLTNVKLPAAVISIILFLQGHLSKDYKSLFIGG
jgi:hypothetical protein